MLKAYDHEDDLVFIRADSSFAALDKRGKGETVTDEELQGLMHKWLEPLHDGHFYATFKNSNSGIVATTSGGRVKSVTITVESGTPTVDIYANNTAYTSAADLYATGENNNQGTKVRLPSRDVEGVETKRSLFAPAVPCARGGRSGP